MWREGHVGEGGLGHGRRAGYVPGAAMAGLGIELVTPDGLPALEAFLDLLRRRYRDARRGIQQGSRGRMRVRQRHARRRQVLPGILQQ